MKNTKHEKKILFITLSNIGDVILTIPTLFFISSCGDETAPVEPEKIDGLITEDSLATEGETQFDPKKYREFDMAAFELNAVIMIPKTYHKEDDEDGTPVDRFDQPDIVHNEGEAKWKIRMPGHKDRYWHMEIDDWGEKVQTIEMLKKEHEGQKNIFDFIYFEEGDGYVRYSKVLKSDNTTISENAKVGGTVNICGSSVINGNSEIE